MKTLLLCGYRSSDAIPLGLERDASGKTLIDRRIHELQALGFEVVCVLAGHSADVILRETNTLVEAELVFDTHSEDANLATNLKAALAATEGEGCFVLPLEVPCPPRPVWDYMRNEWRRLGFQTGISTFQYQGAPWHFPLLVTRSGNKLIQGLTGFTSLSDTRLNYQFLLFSRLAPEAKAL